MSIFAALLVIGFLALLFVAMSCIGRSQRPQAHKQRVIYSRLGGVGISRNPSKHEKLAAQLEARRKMARQLEKNSQTHKKRH